MTPEEIDRARWGAVDDAEAALSMLTNELGRGNLAEACRHADDLAKIARIIADPMSADSETEEADRG